MSFSLAWAVLFLIWACLLVYAATGLADYGGGILDLFAFGPRKELQRQKIAEVLAPIWEVNHIWLIAVVVLLFTSFPGFYFWITTRLHVPLTLGLLGLVSRGASFVFRAYAPKDDPVPIAWGRTFGVASLLTPLALGLGVGGVLSKDGSWTGPLAWAVAGLVVSHGALLAGTYMLGETPDPELAGDFARSARIAGISTAAFGLLALALSAGEAPHLFARLTQGAPALLVHVLTAVFGGLLWLRLGTQSRRGLRPLAWLQTGGLLLGLALAQAPYLRYPEIRVTQDAAPDRILAWVLGIFGVGSLLLVPALAYLFWVFRPPALANQPMQPGELSPSIPSSD